MNTKRPKNYREAKVHDLAVNGGWEVLHKGWPDFIIHKNGEIRMIEVKKKSDKSLNNHKRKNGLSLHQLRIKEILEKHFKYVVLYID